MSLCSICPEAVFHSWEMFPCYCVHKAPAAAAAAAAKVDEVTVVFWEVKNFSNWR